VNCTHRAAAKACERLAVEDNHSHAAIGWASGGGLIKLYRRVGLE